MYHDLFRDASFWTFLFDVDQDLAVLGEVLPVPAVDLAEEGHGGDDHEQALGLEVLGQAADAQIERPPLAPGV